MMAASESGLADIEIIDVICRAIDDTHLTETTPAVAVTDVAYRPEL